MITFRTQVSAYHESGRGPIPGLVRENARAAPELAELIDDLSVIEKHRVGMYMHLHHPLAVGLAVDASLAQWQPARIAVGESGQTRRAAGARNSVSRTSLTRNASSRCFSTGYAPHPRSRLRLRRFHHRGAAQRTRKDNRP